MDRAGRARKVIDVIDFYVERKCHVVPYELEVRVRMQVLHIALTTREQIVDANDFIAASKQAIDQVRAQKAGTAGDQRPFGRVVGSHVWAFVSV